MPIETDPLDNVIAERTAQQAAPSFDQSNYASSNRPMFQRTGEDAARMEAQTEQYRSRIPAANWSSQADSLGVGGASPSQAPAKKSFKQARKQGLSRLSDLSENDMFALRQSLGSRSATPQSREKAMLEARLKASGQYDIGAKNMLQNYDSRVGRMGPGGKARQKAQNALSRELVMDRLGSGGTERDANGFRYSGDSSTFNPTQGYAPAEAPPMSYAQKQAQNERDTYFNAEQGRDDLESTVSKYRTSR